jgi:hypothetical protein
MTIRPNIQMDMNIEFEAIENGAIAFVQLGYATVKQGRVVGHRVTKGRGEKVSVEYLIHWISQGDRPETEEWFGFGRVRATAEDGFKP